MITGNKIDRVDNYDKLKIGELVRKTLPVLLSRNIISTHEIEEMQTYQYSKEVFHIGFPIIRKVNGSEVRPQRYYKDKVIIYGEEYFICSEWYEGTNNNDRPHYLKWLTLRS